LKNASGGSHHRVIENKVLQVLPQIRRIGLGRVVEPHIGTAQFNTLAIESYFRDFKLFFFLSEFMTFERLHADGHGDGNPLFTKQVVAVPAF